MPWNETTRREYARHGRRYASDLTEREQALVGSFLPARKKIRRPRTTELRDVLDAIFYIASTGAQTLPSATRTLRPPRARRRGERFGVSDAASDIMPSQIRDYLWTPVSSSRNPPLPGLISPSEILAGAGRSAALAGRMHGAEPLNRSRR